MSSKKKNVVFALLIIVAIFAIVIADANNISDNTQSFDDLENAALAYYVDAYGDSDVTINVIECDCDIKVIEVIKDGKIILMLEYGNGEIYERL